MKKLKTYWVIFCVAAAVLLQPNLYSMNCGLNIMGNYKAICPDKYLKSLYNYDTFIELDSEQLFLLEVKQKFMAECGQLVDEFKITNARYALSFDKCKIISLYCAHFFDEHKTDESFYFCSTLSLESALYTLTGKNKKGVLAAVSPISYLTELYLGNNNLTHRQIPNYFGPNLRVLDLSSNRLRDLPSKINLPALQVLNLSSNRLKNIPTAVFGLDKLNTLDLSFNILNDISDKISELQNLRILDLSFNLLDKFPTAISELKSLQKLYISANPLSNFPIKFFSPGEFSINNLGELYLDRAQSANLQGLNDKILLDPRSYLICDEEIAPWCYVVQNEYALKRVACCPTIGTLKIGDKNFPNQVIFYSAGSVIFNKRPLWIESEEYVERLLGELVKAQHSYYLGTESRGRTRGSVRPDFITIDDAISIEIKNYNIYLNVNNMIQTIASQAKKRVSHLPKNTIQTVVIDTRGQVELPSKIKNMIKLGIKIKSDGIIKAENIMFLFNNHFMNAENMKTLLNRQFQVGSLCI